MRGTDLKNSKFVVGWCAATAPAQMTSAPPLQQVDSFIFLKMAAVKQGSGGKERRRIRVSKKARCHCAS